MRAPLVCLALLALALAGCSGQVDVKQTEPLRLQLEESEQVAVSQADPEPQKLILETCPGSGTADACGVETVEVEVVVQQPEGPTRVLVRIETESGEPLVEREIVAGGNTTNETTNTMSGTSSTPDTNTTSDSNTTSETTSSTHTTVIQNIVIDVKGKENLVVLTQALEGEADVVVSASDVTGMAQPDDGNSTSPDGI